MEMTREKQPPTISKIVSSSDYVYQGKTDDPPIPLHYKNTVPAETNQKHTTKSFKSKLLCCGTVLGKMKIEIFCFLITFSCVLPKISSSSMILQKVCIAHFKYPQEICDSLHNHTEIKVAVERVSTNYQLGHTLIQTVPAVLISCFVGPWSDHYGRKLPIVIALLGMTLDTFGSVICGYYLNSRVEYYYIATAFTGASGGVVALLAVVYSYVSDMSSFGKRTMKYAFIELSCGLAHTVAVAAGGWIYHFFGYPAVFLFSSGGFVASLIWVVFLLPETRGRDNKDLWSVKLKKLFTLKTFRESFVATAKKRPHHGRKQIILLIMSMCFIIIAINSPADINFLYVHHQFNWSTTEYSTISSIYYAIALALLIVVVPLFIRFKIADSILGLIGTISIIIKFIGIGVSRKPIVFHVANILGLLAICAPLAVRSRISKIVTNDDLGKIFSFVATSESLFPVLTTILTSQIFNAFLKIFPGMPYIILALFLVLPFCVFAWMTRLPVLNSEDMHGKNSNGKARETYTKIDT